MPSEGERTALTEFQIAVARLFFTLPASERAEQMASLQRFDDSDLPVDPAWVAELRQFFSAWRAALLA